MLQLPHKDQQHLSYHIDKIALSAVHVVGVSVAVCCLLLVLVLLLLSSCVWGNSLVAFDLPCSFA